MNNKCEEKLVSVVIPTWNRYEMVKSCIESVLRSDYKNIEIIIIDNASTDGTSDLLNRDFSDEPRVKIWRLNKNLMAAGGRNAGLSHANGELILILDNDNIIHNDMISKLVEAMEKKEDASFMGALTINVKSNTIWVLRGAYQNFWTSRSYAYGDGLPADDIDSFEEYYQTMGAPNAFMIRRNVIDVIGGFDEEFYAMYEEIDFAYRMQKAGMKAYLCTGARTDHYGYVADNQSAKLRQLGIEDVDRTYHFARNRFIMEKKFAKWYQRFVFYLLFANIYTVYYSYIAIKEGRKDIAKAYIKGAMDGYKYKCQKDIFCNYKHTEDIVEVK
ncbi:glycosyltransferase family 2 protein [Butyrivibrio fibrisolvens]|uniref:Glycosyltransferase 2-like domain-containing protein n=1 Tax=Butyrivibrio fibrisolvens TaxID=831 RepID=A0A317FYC4_BUTFI|nr:glycosyltransferase family 2 protein [Butyrivibrio fibrisolvens]PWT26249.1 hypothetical protein CPT75_03485 [Butyrivibrio fibrisolvens]